MSTATLADPTDLQAPAWLDSESLYEIIDGEFVEKELMSATAYRLATFFASVINAFTMKKLGSAACEVLIKLPGVRNSYRPDMIYVSYKTWPKTKPIKDTNAWRICPELVVEVVSPTDRHEKLMEKMEEYFEGGVSQVWLYTPSTKLLHVYTSPTDVRGYKPGEPVGCATIIPGFQFDLNEIL